MKNVLFKQFEKEIKGASANEINVMIETIEWVEKRVNSSNLETMIGNIKGNFDSIIMDDEEYKNSTSIYNELIAKYKDVDSFKTSLIEFKEVLKNPNKTTKTNKSEKLELEEVIKNVVKETKSKVNFIEEVKEETVVEQEEVAKEDVKEEEEVAKEDVKIIVEDGPISDEMMVLLDEIKNCIGTELFTEDNFDERISMLHKSGLLTRLMLANEELKSNMVDGFEIDEVTDEELSEFLNSNLGLKLLRKGIDVECMNYIIELINDIEEAAKEEITVESNTTFTDTVKEETKISQPVEEETKTLMERVIEKCNQEADVLSKELLQAEQVLRQDQTVTNIPVNNSVFTNPTIVKEVIENAQAEKEVKVEEESIKVESKEQKQQPKKKDICRYQGCTNKKHTGGYCHKHYKELKEQGIIGGGNNAK